MGYGHAERNLALIRQLARPTRRPIAAGLPAILDDLDDSGGMVYPTRPCDPRPEEGLCDLSRCLTPGGCDGLWCPTYDAAWACLPRQTFCLTGCAGRPLLIDGSTVRPPRCRNRR
jgi:hypothetical protein